MLVLSRKTGQQIYIGSDIVITVLDISGKSARIGVAAPDRVSILRGEVKEQIESENKLAASRIGYLEHLKNIGFPFRKKSD